MKFAFKMDVVVEARGIEEALDQVLSHISIVKRQQASGVDNVAAEFTIAPADDKATVTDLSDKVTQSNGPIDIELDPNSAAGVARAEQLEREKTEREDLKARLANVDKTDAEIMAEHSAKEQAALNG